MENKLGVVGLGHWFSWLKAGIGEGGSLNLKKAVGTKPFEYKQALLSSFDITKDNYYLSDRNGGLPDQFFEGIDIVHISDPNEFHYEQVMQSLGHGKYVIVEKTLAVNKSQFSKLSSFIKKNNYKDRVYLHLHYLHKQATMSFAAMVPKLVKKYGKIKSIDATFFEQVDDEDPKRTWILKRANGGIFMDWIHPYEIIYYSTKCKFGNIQDLKIFMVNGNYDQNNPTGVEATIALTGKKYSEGATAKVRVAKGVREGLELKSINVIFESGIHAHLCFPGHEAEFGNKELRGRIDLVDNGKLISSEHLTGPNSSEIFIKEISDFINGQHPGLTISEISRVFKPQWEYQKIVKSKELIKDETEINRFLQEGTGQHMRC